MNNININFYRAGKICLLILIFIFLTSIIIAGCESKNNEDWSGFGPSQHFPAPYEYNHPGYLAANNYPLSDCQECHGEDFNGGTTGISCIGCHNQNGVPEGCNDCHGNPTGNPLDPVMQAPPFDLSGNSSTDSIGVGAHTSHLAGVQFSDGIPCSSCHTVPAAENFLWHLGAAPAEVNFSGLASWLDHHPVWNHSDEECSNTYCHGNAEPEWTNVSANEAECGSCHSIPPGPPHYIATIDDCHQCHGGVINDAGDIINKVLHINGAVNGN